MRYLISMLLLAGLVSLANAGAPVVGPQPTTGTADQWSSSMTISAIQISTFIPTSVVVSTWLAWRSVAVENLCATADLYCSENSVTLSTSITSASQGWLIPRSTGSFTFTLLPGENFFCQAGVNATACQAIVKRAR